MSVSIKSAREIQLMREAGKRLELVHAKLAEYVKPGISTKDIDRYGEKLIRDMGCIPNFLNYNGYPASICVSVNDEVVHGIPSDEHILMEGDIVSLDAGLIYEGYHSDAARTHAVGEISEEARKLIQVTQDSFFKGIEFAREGRSRYQQPLVPTLKDLDMEWSETWLDMESAHIFMKTRRSLILHSVEGASVLYQE